MRLLCWNYQKLVNPRTVQALSFLFTLKTPIILLMLETKFHASDFYNRHFHWSYACHFIVDVVGRVSGLILLWFDEVNLHVVLFSGPTHMMGHWLLDFFFVRLVLFVLMSHGHLFVFCAD